MTTFANHTFAVTGGGSGLGRAVVEALLARQANVIVIDRDETRGQAVAALAPDRTEFAVTDVTDAAGVQAILDRGVTRFGALRGMICCAGIGAAVRTATDKGPHDLDLFKLVINVNLIGTFNCLRLASALMAHNQPDEGGERGVCINTASIAAYDGQIGQVAYAASKGGVVGLTLPAARDMSRCGVRVGTIAPGLFDTPLLASLPEDARKALAQNIPFPQRLGNPAEYAALAMHILENRMINGEVIRIDGALRMAPK